MFYAMCYSQLEKHGPYIGSGFANDIKRHFIKKDDVHRFFASQS